MKPIILEFGMGAHVHGNDYTKATIRALHDAIRHSSLTLFQSYKKPSDMEIEVFVAVTEPSKVDRKLVAASVPFGDVRVTVVAGGLNDKGMGGLEEISVACIGVKVYLDTEDHSFKCLGD